jgi:iron complex transport system substrate-binding protein
VRHRPPSPTRRRASRAAAPAAAILAVVASLAACGSSGSPTAAASPRPHHAYPVTVTSCGVPVTYDRAPARGVSNDINATEVMLALGLESHMAGTFGVTGDGPVGNPVPAQYLAGFHKVRDVSSGYFTREELVGLRPDFLFAGWNYGLEQGTSLTPSGLAQFRIKTLVLTESCVHVQKHTDSVSINDTYQDLRNLGEVFNVRARARRVITAMHSEVAAARARVGKLKPVTVFVYDSGQAAPFTAPGLSTPTALITLGGGTNIFAGLKQSWTSVSWEQVVRKDPQCIIINDYGKPTAAQKEKFLETSPITRNLTAVKRHCFLPLSYDELTPGPRNARAVTAIARWLHPAAYGLPPNGS